VFFSQVSIKLLEKLVEEKVGNLIRALELILEWTREIGAN
jgi:hypothetical protein